MADNAIAPSQGLTSTQREALEWLKSKRDALPLNRWPYGFNPPNGRRSMVAAMRTSLASRGLVELQLISERHIRYEITDAGRVALAKASPSPPSPQEPGCSGRER